MTTAANSSKKASIQPTWISLVRGQVESMRYGIVQIVVHDSRVVQIERTEKLRLEKLDSRTSFLGTSAIGGSQQRFVPPPEETALEGVPGQGFSADQVTGGSVTP